MFIRGFFYFVVIAHYFLLNTNEGWNFNGGAAGILGAAFEVNVQYKGG